MTDRHSVEPIAKLEPGAAHALNLNESLVSAFERVVSRFPSRIALGSSVWEPTYQELNETANRLAHRLIGYGTNSGDRVAVLMSHDAPMVAAVIGILKARQIVVALNPDDPVARLKMLVEDTQPSVVVTDGKNRALVAEFTPPNCRILDFESEIASGPVNNPPIEIRSEETAFLTFTSGTTGHPKGVMRTHRQVLHTLATHTEAMQYTENDRISLLSVVSTAHGSNGLWWGLLNGAMLCLFPVKTRGVTGLADWIIERRLTVYISSASIFRTMIKTIDDGLVFSDVRAVRLASEGVTADDFRLFQKHFPAKSIFVHTLSSSETSTIAWSRWTREDDVPERTLPVGYFSRGLEVLLVDDHGKSVGRGEIGEIVVKSRYVASGYWCDPELTAERFSADLDGKGTRSVRTGDLGRINADGLLEFCGRKDDRIKIRGSRIELLDIERTLEKLPGIHSVAAVAVRRETHDPLLVAFVVKARNASWTTRRLRHAARAILPPPMVPSRIVFLESLPYNAGNKVDRDALRSYSLLIRGENQGDAPRTETEMWVANIWAEILERPDINRDNDFFDLGGDSLQGALVVAQIHAEFGVEVSLGSIADHATVSALAAFIDECRRTKSAKIPPIVRTSRGAPMPLSFFQEPHFRPNPEYTHLRSYRVIGPINIEIFKECLSYLIDRHEILRTTFAVVDSHPAQIIHRSAPLGFCFIDLADTDDPEGQADGIFREAASLSINLEKLPILRHILVRVATNNYRFARIDHLIISDGYSNQVLSMEFAILYEARVQGLARPLLTEPPLQYADFAVWQRLVMQPDRAPMGELAKWWVSHLSSAPAVTRRLPFRRLIPLVGLDPSEGVVRWRLEERVAKRLDDLACRSSATYFTVGLAALAALIADVTDNPTVVIGTYIDSRSHVETQNMVGRFLNTIPLVFYYDASKTFLEWLEIVRLRVFEARKRSQLPYLKLCEKFCALGIRLPEIQIFFMMASDHTDQHFGDLTISNEFWSVGVMPPGCTVYVDERKPDYCRVNFDAGIYDRNGIHTMLDRYLRLLEVASREPELPIGALLAKIGAKPLRWTCANYAATFYKFLKPYYDSSPLLKMCWRHAKRWVFR
jgi:amino acid adenylation domain-containing protein